MGSMNGLSHLHTLSTPRQFQSPVFRPLPSNGVIGRLNTPSGLDVHGLPSSRNIQLGYAQNLNNSLNDPLKFRSTIVPGNQNGNSVLEMTGYTESDQLQHHKNKSISSVQDMTNASCSHTSLPSIRNNSLMVAARPQNTQGGRAYENLPSIESQPSEISCSLPDHGSCTDNWSDGVQSSQILPNPFPPTPPGFPGQMAVSPTENLSSTSTPLRVGNPGGASSITLMYSQSHDVTANGNSQGDILANAPGNISSNVPFQGWDDRNHDSVYRSNVMCSPLNSLIPVNGGVSGSDSPSPTDPAFYRKLDFNCGNPIRTRNDGFAKLAEEIPWKHGQGFIIDQQMAQHISNNLGSLDDLIGSMMT